MTAEAQTVVQYLDLACSITVILILVALSLANIKAMIRVTVRLVAEIVLENFLGHISVILALGSKAYIGTSHCQELSAIININRFMYVLTNITICYHLYNAISLLKKTSLEHETIFWAIFMLAVGLIMVVEYLLGIFNGTANNINCFPIASIHDMDMTANILL